MKSNLILGAAFTLLAGMQYTNAVAQQKSETRSTTISSEGESQISTTEDGHRYRMRLSGSKLTELYVDDKKIAEEDFSKYDSLVKKILVQLEKDRKQAEKDRAQAELDRKQADKDRAQAELDRQQADKDRQTAEKDRETAEKDRHSAEEDRKRADEDRKRADEDRERADQDRARADEDRKQAEVDRKQADKDRIQADKDRKQADIDRKMIDDMLTEVVSQKLVENKDAIKLLTLNSDELSINGIKQTAEMHAKFKKYLKDNQTQIEYHFSSGSRGINITRK